MMHPIDYARATFAWLYDDDDPDYRDYLVTPSHASREVRRQKSAWRYWAVAIGLIFAILMAIAWTGKAISQAAYDAVHFEEMER